MKGKHASNQKHTTVSAQKYVPEDSTVAYGVKPDKKGNGKKIALGIGIFFGIVLVIALAVYGIGFWYFSSHFYPGSSINGEDVSMEESTSVSDYLSDYYDQKYIVNVTGDGFSLELTSENAGIGIDADDVVASCMDAQQAAAWPLKFSGTHYYDSYVTVGYDSASLKSVVDEAVASFNESATAPVDASVAFDDESATFVVNDGKAGTALDADKVYSEVCDGIDQQLQSITLSDDCLQQPAVNSDDANLKTACDTANSYLNCNCEIDLGDNKVSVLDSAQIAKWVTVTSAGEVSLDEDAVTSWAKELADSCNTVGTERAYTRPDGKEVTVSGGTYGWTVDTDAFVESVEAAVKAGSNDAISLPCSQTGNGYTAKGQDWGLYVDVDLTQQHARCYDASGSLLWESDVVTGTPDGTDDTPTGVYMINAMQKDVTLIGVTDESTGKPSYESPVAYWMPFVDNMVGLHDATWQSAFGGTRYKDGYGSHGCVNLPLDKAAEIYDILQVGDCVVVHW